MSRIGKQPIKIEDTSKIYFDNLLFKVTGANGELKLNIPSGISVDILDGYLHVKADKSIKNITSLWGLTRSLINNMVKGVNDYFVKKLVLVGPGFKAALQDDLLILKLGFSHDIIYAFPKTLKINCTGNNIEISGSDKQLVGQVAAEIRDFRKPDPYKAKGIKYFDEVIIKKKGKDSK